MVFFSLVSLVAASLVLAGALGLSIWQRTGEQRYVRAIDYIVNDADEDDLAVVRFFLQLREYRDLIDGGADR